MRRKIFRMLIAAQLCLGLCAATGCNAEELSSLKDISRPYVGEYKCRKLQIGEKSELERFEFIKLDLSYGGEFTLFYREADGNEDSYGGAYQISEERALATFSSKLKGQEQSFSFPYEKGKIFLQLQFNEKMLYAEFSMIE